MEFRPAPHRVTFNTCGEESAKWLFCVHQRNMISDHHLALSSTIERYTIDKKFTAHAADADAVDDDDGDRISNSLFFFFFLNLFFFVQNIFCVLFCHNF